MENWAHKYRHEKIPGPGPNGVINKHTPGKLIAKAITEIQEKAITKVGRVSLTGLNGTVSVKDNTLDVNLAIGDEEGGGALPPGGNAGQVIARDNAGGAEWRDQYPAGGNPGDIIRKAAGGNLSATWDAEYPAEGQAGQVLHRKADASDVYWDYAVPSGGSDGNVLTRKGEDGLEWTPLAANPPDGTLLSFQTIDGQGYWQKLDAEDNQVLIWEGSESTGDWVQKDTQEVEVITDISIGDGVIQVKKRKLRVIDPGLEGDLETIHEGVQCD